MTPRRSCLHSARWTVAVAALLAACDGSKKQAHSPQPSASAPAELSTSWQTDPGHLLSPGETAPDFEAIAHTGQRILLSKLLDKPAVLLFYAGDTAPPSSTLVEQVRDAWLELNPHISMVFGISGDHNVVHRDFATERDLPFLLVSDADESIGRAFGVSKEKLPVTFIVKPDRTIASVLTETKPAEYARELKKTLAAPG